MEKNKLNYSNRTEFWVQKSIYDQVMFFQKLPTQLNEEKYTLQELVLAQLDIDIQKKKYV